MPNTQYTVRHTHMTRHNPGLGAGAWESGDLGLHPSSATCWVSYLTFPALVSHLQKWGLIRDPPPDATRGLTEFTMHKAWHERWHT